jgi:serine/threonine-protein kinase
LAEYYAGEGRTDPIVISIPKGAYIPVFVRAGTPPPAAPSPAAREAQSIAVLPFVSMSGDPENEYFSDGLTEELINVLTYVPGLRVVARTSVFCFKNVARDVREIGAQLNVRTVLEGSVRRAGNQLRVTAQLIDVSTGYHLFSRTFPREIKDVFAVQEELAGAVVTEIMPQVRAESQPLVRNYTADLDAYTLYLKGMFTMSNRFTGARDCVEIFRQVLDRDPAFAPAWAGLANAYCMQAWYDFLPSKVAMPLARDAALKALELDDALGLAHAALGMARSVLDWNWEGAEDSYRRAIAAQPGLAAAHQYYAFTCLMPQRRFQEGIASTERALLLNPFDAVLSGAAMAIFAGVGDFDAVYRQHLLSKESNPNHPVTYGGLGGGYVMIGRYQEAINEFRKAAELSHRASYPVAGMGHALAKSGDLAAAGQILEELLMRPPFGFGLALVHVGLGNHAEAIRWFEMAMEKREPHILAAAFDVRFAQLL